MKIFKNQIQRIVFLCIIFLCVISSLFVYGGTNPSRGEIEKMIEKVAAERGIPAVILKSVAKVESTYRHYNNDGTPRISGGCIGLMMIKNYNDTYDDNKLKYDIEYNIEAGADMLLNKWSLSSYRSISSVGDMDPNILENWYFALWAYNGWAQSNNPHMLASYSKSKTYQQLVYDVSKKDYNQNINMIDTSYLPKSGLPQKTLIVPTPSNVNYGNIKLYEIGDIVKLDGIRNLYNLRNVPAGKYVHEIKKNTLAIIEEGPILKNGFYWYKVNIDDKLVGWIERNYILKTGEETNGKYVFIDIRNHEEKDIIMGLYEKGIISEAKRYNPNEISTKEEFCVLISRALDLAPSDASLPFSDVSQINSWAIQDLQNIYYKGFLNHYVDKLNPKDKITRLDAAMILSNILNIDEEYETVDIRQIYLDTEYLLQNEQLAVKSVYTNNIMLGKYDEYFMPNDYLTRADVAVIIEKILNSLDKFN